MRESDNVATLAVTTSEDLSPGSLGLVPLLLSQRDILLQSILLSREYLWDEYAEIADHVRGLQAPISPGQQYKSGSERHPLSVHQETGWRPQSYQYKSAFVMLDQCPL